MNYNWAIVGTGAIAEDMAAAFANSNRNIYAVYNRTFEKAENFAGRHKVKKIYYDYDCLLADENINIIYIATPHNLHAELIFKALNKGKHVLCEKSITVNIGQLLKLKKLAEEKNLILAEAMTIYNMPIYNDILNLCRKKAGDPKMIQLQFAINKPFDASNRFYNSQLAGGALLDFGVYALSFIRLFCSDCPQLLSTQAVMTKSGVDDYSVTLLKDGNLLAEMSLSLSSFFPQTTRVICERGYIDFQNFIRGNQMTIIYPNMEKETICIGDVSKALEYEIVNMEKSIKEGKNSMKLDFSCEVMHIMTQMRKKWGLWYDFEDKF